MEYRGFFAVMKIDLEEMKKAINPIPKRVAEEIVDRWERSIKRYVKKKYEEGAELDEALADFLEANIEDVFEIISAHVDKLLKKPVDAFAVILLWKRIARDVEWFVLEEPIGEEVDNPLDATLKIARAVLNEAIYKVLCEIFPEVAQEKIDFSDIIE